MKIILGFYQQQPGYRLANDFGLNSKTATRVYQRLRKTIHHVGELEADGLIREIESDKAYFGGRRKGSEDVAQREKALLLVSRSAINISTREQSRSVSADELLAHIRAYQEKIGLHHRYIPQLWFLEKVWKTSYR